MASENDFFQKKGAGTVTTLAAPGKALGATSITVGSTANYPTETGITIGIRQVDTAGDLISGTYTEWTGVVASGTSITINATPVYGSDQVYPAGSTTQVYIPLSSTSHNRLVDGILTHANQDGLLKASALDGLVSNDSLDTTAGEPGGAWLEYTPTCQGLSIGNGVIVGRYTQIGKTIRFNIYLRFGSSTTKDATAFNFSLPITSRNDYPTGVFTGRGLDAGTKWYSGVGNVLGSATGEIDDTYNSIAWTGTNPFTWGTSDEIYVSGTYETA